MNMLKDDTQMEHPYKARNYFIGTTDSLALINWLLMNYDIILYYEKTVSCYGDKDSLIANKISTSL